MADGHATRLLGVVLEVCLDVLVGVIADDLDGVLVRANRTVAAQAPELALDGARCRRIGAIRILGKGEMGDIIVDADSEFTGRIVLFELLVDGKGTRRWRVLAAEAIAAANDGDAGTACLEERGDDILVQGLADGARLLGAVHDGNLLDRAGKNVDEVIDGEGTIESNLDEANLLAMRVEVIDDLLDDIAEGAHGDDDTVCVRCTVIVEQTVIRTELLVDLVHVLLDDGGKLIIGGVARLTMLEEDVVVLMRATRMRMLGVEAVVAERLDRVHVDHVREVGVIPLGDLLNLVGGAEAVEEVEERHVTLDGGKMRHRCEVHNLLDVALGEHGEARLTAAHDIGVIAEDVERMGRKRTCAYVEDAR